MQLEPEESQPRTHAEVGARPTSVGLSRDDYLTIYGPLGIGWTILIAMLTVLWKSTVSKDRTHAAALAAKDKEHAETMDAARAEFLAELERRDKECKAERGEAREAMVALTREQAETMKQLDDRWRDVVRELRSALDSALRKISRRE